MIKCQICGREFKKISGAHLKTHGLNAASYRDMGFLLGTEKKCEICDEIFVPGHRKQRFCSKECSYEHRSRTYRGENHPQYGKTFSHTEETKKKISQNNARYWLGKKRSKEDVQKFIDSHVGLYHGRPLEAGRVEENLRERKSGKMKRWTRAIKKRDNHTCQVCFRDDLPMIAHHIFPFAFFDKVRFWLDNGITLCIDCHSETLGNELEFVNRFGWRMGKPIVPLQFLEEYSLRYYNRPYKCTDEIRADILEREALL